METTIEKSNINQLKSEIKKLAEKQKYYKNQRKTDHIVGKREMPAYEAQWRHAYGRHDLRLLYAAYGLMRGKAFEQIEKRINTQEVHPLEKYRKSIEKIIEKYSTSNENNLPK